MEGPDISKTFSFGFLSVSLPPLQSTGHFTHRRAARGTGEFLSKAVLQCFSSNAGETDWDLRGQSLLPADQLMHKKVPKPLLLLKGMPCLTAEVLRALLPSALCSGYAHWRPVCIHRNGSTVSIRSIWLDSQMQCWAPGHHRQAATLGRKEAS